MIPLQRFNESATCQKCGHSEIATHYQGEYKTGACDLYLCPTGEHMHRICKRCGFVWSELCLGDREASA